MDTTVRLGFAAAGALIGILAPRYSHVTPMAFATLLAVLGAVGFLVFHGAEIWMVVAVLPLLALGTLLLTRWLPRLGTLRMLLKDAILLERLEHGEATEITNIVPFTADEMVRARDELAEWKNGLSGSSAT